MLSGGNGRGGKAGATLAASALAACALAAALLGAAGCGSSSPSTSSWAQGLGTGVTVLPPGSPAPGNDSPGGVMLGVIDDLSAGKVADFCRYEQPSRQTACNAQMSQVTPAMLKGQLPTFKNVKLGYVAIDGTKALIGLTGTICVPGQTPSCYTNDDPAALFDSGKSFGTLWSVAQSAASNVYSLSPAVQIDGSWYAVTTSGS